MNLAYCARIIKSAYDIPLQKFASTGFYYEFHGDSLYIGMTGTDSLDDGLVNIHIIPNFKGCHRGFNSRAKAILPKVVEIIETYASMRFIPNTFRVVLCGHSLSGALSQILCTLLRNKYKYIMATTFGSPKVWLRGCSPKFDHIRCIQKDDPVPKLLGIFYKHNGQEVITGDDDLGVEVKDHYIESYIKSLEK